MKNLAKNYLSLLCIALILMMVACKSNDPSPAVTPPPTPPPVLPITAFIPDGWKALEPFAGGVRNAAVAVNIGDKIYVGLGYSSTSGNSQVSNDWYEYDPATDKWTSKSNFPGASRANAVAFVINGKAYVGLGTNYDRVSKSDLYTDFYEYNPATNLWVKKADFSGTPRDQSVCFAIGEKGYLGTGNIDAFQANNTKEFYEYNATKDVWTKKADFLGSARCRSFGFSMNGKGYIGGGEDNDITKQSDFYEYDADTDKWLKKASLPSATARARGFSFNNLGYAVGGLVQNQNANLNDIYKYNPTDNTWATVSEIAAEKSTAKGRFYPITISTKTKIYIGLGGRNAEATTNLKDFYELILK